MSIEIFVCFFERFFGAIFGLFLRIALSQSQSTRALLLGKCLFLADYFPASAPLRGRNRESLSFL